MQKKERIRKRVRLTDQEKAAFAKKVSEFDTKIDASEFFGFSMVTINAVLLRGYGSQAIVALIREKIKK